MVANIFSDCSMLAMKTVEYANLMVVNGGFAFLTIENSHEYRHLIPPSIQIICVGILQIKFSIAEPREMRKINKISCQCSIKV